MGFFLEMFQTAVVALLFSFLVAKLVSVAMAGNGGKDLVSDQVLNCEIGVCDDFVLVEELRFGMKMDARVVDSEINFGVVDENLEPVDCFGNEADRVDELQEAAAKGNGKIRNKGEKMVVVIPEAESTDTLSPGNVLADEMIDCGQGELSSSAEEINGKFGAESELMVKTPEAESTASVSSENVVAEEIMIQRQEERSESTEKTSSCLENEVSGDVVIAKSEIKIEDSNNKMDENEEKKELSIEEDDDWEGIERTELEKTFAAATKYLEESKKAEEIGAEAKMELYGLHKIATEGPCREAQPMAVMVTSRAKWNAWQKLGNMSQEEAMEQYLALTSKEIPDFINTGYTIGKLSEMESSVVLTPTTLDTTGVAFSKNG